MATDSGTVGITGIPLSHNVPSKTETIPYAPGMPNRHEITQWFEQMISSSDSALQKQWTLFVVGLERFKSLPVDDKLSYFQVAGIHGYPEQTWDNADPPKPDPDPKKLRPGDQPFGGYCHHNTVAFPTWHRPYMLLFEQCLWNNMEAVIHGWNLPDSERETWFDAAAIWRLPYWDWARKQTYPGEPDKQYDDFGIPYLFTLEVVPVFLPSGRRNDYPNPLWKFENPERDANGKPLAMGSMPPEKKAYNIKDDNTSQEQLPWSLCTGTSRWGILRPDPSIESWTGLEGNNNWQHANEALATTGKRWYKPRKDLEEQDPDWDEYKPGSLADAVNRMFSPDYNGTWGTFSSTKWFREFASDVRTGYMSLEYIHNNVHNICGGDTAMVDETDPTRLIGLGHMCDVPVAAFDPIFWLHHCNIDRLTAMWQVLNWSKWWDQQEGHTATIPVQDVLPDDPLVPFHTTKDGDPKKDYWTSAKARDWTKLNYSYDTLDPEPTAIAPDGSLNEDRYKRDLEARIHKIYPGTSYLAYDIREEQGIKNANFFGEISHSQAWEDYLINVVYDRYALNGSSYAIRFYLRREGEQIAASTSADDYIGQIYSLGGMAPTEENGGCANCTSQHEAKILSKGQVAISIPIMRQAADPSNDAISSIKESDVTSYLQSHLYWKFVQAGGAERPAEDFPNTKIAVWGGRGYARKVQDEDTLEDTWLTPEYKSETYRPLYDATETKVCGLGKDDAMIRPEMFASMALLEVQG